MKKPIIRHCKNCKWTNFKLGYYNHDNDIWCNVRYKRIVDRNQTQRKQALFCPYFEAKGVSNNDL